MSTLRRIQKIERRQRHRPCPLCARGVGMKRYIQVDHERPLSRSDFACPACGAAPIYGKVVRIVRDEADQACHGG